MPHRILSVLSCLTLLWSLPNAIPSAVAAPGSVQPPVQIAQTDNKLDSSDVDTGLDNSDVDSELDNSAIDGADLDKSGIDDSGLDKAQDNSDLDTSLDND